MGSISPSAFHVAQTSRLVQLLEPAPGIRFTSWKGASSALNRTEDETIEHNRREESVGEFFAHRAGVNVLAIDHYEGR